MLVYVAAPYSNVPDKEKLMDIIARVSAKYMLENPGEYTITGLVHHYACQHESRLGTDWAFWKDFCELFLKRCDKLLVIMYSGWWESGGVQAEIKLAEQLEIPVQYICPYTYLNLGD